MSRSLSVVMPVYNEEESIEAAVAEVKEQVLDRVPGSELCVVDDGSRDRTAEILDRLASADGRVRVVHQRNGGHGAAILTGLRSTTADWILLVDSDRQIVLDCFGLAWQRRVGVDAVFGERSHRDDPAVRKLVSAVLKLQLRTVYGLTFADANAPFKLISRGMWDRARQVIPSSCLIPSVFLAVYAHRTGLRTEHIPVAYRKRSAGRTTLRKLKLIKFSARSFAQLVAFRAALVAVAGVERNPVPAPAAKKL